MLSTTELVKENTQFKKDIDQKDQRITLPEEMLRVQRHKDYGASSEKDSGQGQLFNEAEDNSLTAESEVVDIVVPAHTRKKKKRVSIPADLPREDIIHNLAEADKVCPHDGSELKLIGEEASEQLDIEPAKIKVLRHRRQKYACPCCEQYLITANKPVQPIEKSIAASGLLAYVAVSKYCDALPLYRQIAIFKRIGIELDRTTLANWMIKIGALVQLLINRLSEIANEQSVPHMDETPLQVLNEPNKTAQSKSYMWVLATTQASVPIVLYHYSANRSGDVPVTLLPDFTGVLMVDGYEGYAAVCTKHQLTRLGCWAHARTHAESLSTLSDNNLKGKQGKRI